MTLTCERANALFAELRTEQLHVTAAEIDELLAQGLAVEADPDDLALAGWIESTCQALLHKSSTAPDVVSELGAILQHANKDLASDWYRMTTGRTELDRREAERVTVRRALGYLGDGGVQEMLQKLAAQGQTLAKNARYLACPALGVELYALTQKGAAASRALAPRLDRFTGVPLKNFLASWSKVEGKMAAFATQVQTLNDNIGFVKKARHEVVIGLAKTGLQASEALHTYSTAHHTVGNPSDAVTCARNAAQFGGPHGAAKRLRDAENELRRAGFPASPMLLGAAKSLIPFVPIERGVHRFVALKRGFDHLFGTSDTNYKFTSRMMAATGEPPELLQRTSTVLQALARHPGADRAQTAATAVAIAAMVRNATQIEEAVVRLRALESGLVSAQLANEYQATSLALECLACPGSPTEVVSTVRTLAGHVAKGQRTVGDIAIAAAFAKRFAY